VEDIYSHQDLTCYIPPKTISLPTVVYHLGDPLTRLTYIQKKAYIQNNIVLEANLSWSRTRAKFCQLTASLFVLSFVFALIVRLKDLKFELFQFIGVESQINLQITGKISLEFDFNSSLLL